ncbi:MAG TPA: phage portal protein, partial [Vicinamibacterales bacterium]
MASRLSKIRTALARAIAPKPPQKRNAFAGAGFNRLTSDWVMAATRSADQETRYELKTLRNRARDLDRNSPFGARYSQLVAENVIGDTGIRLKAKNKLKDGTALHRGANKGIEDGWLDWSRAEHCDVTKKLTLTECLALAVSEWATDGEILIRMWEGPQFGPYGFMIQILDPDYLDETMNQERMGPNTPLIRQGIEYDAFGAPTFYYLWTRHPSEPSIDRTREKVPAEQIVHTFIPRRAGQSRGIPHAAAIMTTIKMLDGYVEAELVAARVASASMGAVVDQQNADGPAINPNATGDENGNQNAIPTEAEPASLLDLRGMGAELKLWDPQHPTSAFPDFTRMMSHYVAIGFGVSYGTLTGDLSQANYGSLRVGMLDERTHWRRLQGFVVSHVLDRIYRRWLKMALLNRMIEGISDYDWKRWTRVLWKPRGFDWIDPLKDVQGELIEIAAGMNSLQRACAERGLDFEEILEERAEDIRLAEQYGVPIVLATTMTNKTADDAQDEAEQGDRPLTESDAAAKSFSKALP